MVTTRSKTKSLPPARVQIPRDESEEPDDGEYEPEIRAPKRLRTKVKKEEEEIVSALDLMDFPQELLREIASHTFPGDLISLSRTSKQWRELLMKRTAEKTWLFAESNIPELPAYPWSNMSPVRYATLLFTKHCTVCGEITTISADPYLMVRLCVECRETKLIELVGREYLWTGPEKLVCVTNMMTFRKKNAEKRPRGSGPLKYCLRKELEELRATFRELSQPGCEVAFTRWKTEVKDELDLRKQFGATLKSFLRLIENTRYEELEKIKRERSNEVNKRLFALGYTEPELKIHYSLSNKWRALVEQPRVLSDRVWENILPKLTPILEANKAQADEDAKSTRKTKRQAELHRLLRNFKLETHPLADMVRALGYEPKLPQPATSNGATSGTTTTLACVSRFLNTYPFPDTYTALEWPFFKDVTTKDMSLEDVKVLFDAHRKEVEEQARTWRGKIERGLTQKVLLDEGLPPLSDIVEVNGSTDSTASLSPLTQLLLRADTIFTTSKDASYDEKLLHYPFFIPTKDAFWSYGWPQTICVSQYVFHSKACEVARALLDDLDKPDASGLDMNSAGNAFRCGRCTSFRPVNWDGILKHYLHEHEISALLSSSTPRFKTRHPITFENTHNLEHGGLVLDQEVDGGSASVPCDPVYCLPCKNHGRMFVGVEQGQMNCHLKSVHDVVSGIQNIHWGLVLDSGTFLENGGAWRERWDEHYDEQQKTHGQDVGGTSSSNVDY
ncbi:F-box protein [Rhizoctonia solani AG-3 Rhs1AP]|uniref:F-box protein n=1 Tax=Rhizoctonia solani AG-3 Rhs1AP TaxID=1086054 RepID=X8J468_9AGAM|nr:F-box protein [Rhizoctonia solani AG-3 Rhs1AP]